jgi:DNA-binding response OmpR family regulator
MSRVLVIDDESVVATILEYAFAAMGHDTIAADGGETGIDAARTEHPDAIVLDLMMPEVSGLDVLDALRHDDETSSVPILVLTAVTMSREHLICVANGADRVMTKPFDPRDVAEVVDSMMSPARSVATGS